MFALSVQARLLAALLLAGLLGAATLAPVRAQDKKEDKKDEEVKKLTDKEVQQLIDQIGDEDEKKRQEAEDKLLAHAEQVSEAVRKAKDSHLDPDVRLRATVLIKKLATAAYRLLYKLEGHEKPIRSLAVSKDGKRLLSGGQDGTLRVWDLTSRKEAKKFTIPTFKMKIKEKDDKDKEVEKEVEKQPWTWDVGFSPDEKEVFASGGQDTSIRLWSLESGKVAKKYEGFKPRVYAAAMSRDGKYVLGGEGGLPDETEKPTHDALLIDKESGKVVHRLKGHSGYIWRAAFSPSGEKVVTVGLNDSSARIWDVASGKELANLKDAHGEGNYVTSVAFLPDGKGFLTGGRDNLVRQWTMDGKVAKTYEGTTGAEALAVSPDGKRFVVADGKSMVLYDLEGGKAIFRYEEMPEDVWAVAFTPDGNRAISAGGNREGGKDFVIRVWNVAK